MKGTGRKVPLTAGDPSPWVRFTFRNDMGDSFGARIHRIKRIGIGFIEFEDDKFRIRNNRILGAMTFSGEEFEAIAKAWQEVTGVALQKPAWLMCLELLRAASITTLERPAGSDERAGAQT